jgi:magnesium transporter
VLSVILWGTIVGSLLPLILRRLGFDPAVSSTPLVATLMDASGTLIYLAAAIVLLTGVVL